MLLGGGGWSQKTKEYHTDTVRRGGRGQEWAGPGASVSFPIRRARRDAKKERERTKKTKEERKRSIFKQKKRTKKTIQPPRSVRVSAGQSEGEIIKKRRKTRRSSFVLFFFVLVARVCVEECVPFRFFSRLFLFFLSSSFFSCFIENRVRALVTDALALA